MSSDLTPEQLRGWLVDWVNTNIASVAELGGADPDRPLEELGLSSRDAVSLVGDLEDLLDENISPTLAWEVPTINKIVNTLLADDSEARAANADAMAAAEALAAEATGGADSDSDDDDLIAVIGVGCRLPGGVDGPDSYWDLLTHGRDAIATVPEGRWGQFIESTPANDAVLARTTRWGGFLDDVAGFDAEFFGISPREAEVTDPQQRLLLEVAWEALEHAGVNPDELRGSATGVFVGISVSEYSHLTARDITAIDAWTSTGSALSIAANRLSYLLDLRGPSMAIDTACSSSLVALHNACTSLRTRESNTAIVGGVNLLLAPTITANFDLGGVLAADGRCKSFGADADGIVRGEGCGAVVIKRLADARRDGDRVLAVIRGSAVNSDGRSNGLMAPNPQAQEALLRTAYARAGVNPTEVDYVEAHGTGTLLGDPIEAGALGTVLGRDRDPSRPLLIGSAKSNLGHLEAAAGIAGIIKVVLSLANGRIPASLHAEQTNPHIRFERDRLQVASAAAEWPRYSGRAVAGVSGFGFGGTNAHVVFTEALEPAPAKADVADNAVIALSISAISTPRLSDTASRLAEWLATSDEALVDVAASLNDHRGHGAQRAAVVGRSRDELIAALRVVGSDDARVVTGSASAGTRGPVWVFSGYGSQWAGMSARLIADEPVFAAAMEEVSFLVDTAAGLDVMAGLQSATAFETVAQNQVAIFCVQIALAALWRSRGVEPAAIIGHSMGEVSAAVVSGALSLADGVRVMAVRSALLSSIDSAGAGAMAVVDMTADEFSRWSTESPVELAGVTIAVYGAPTQCTVAGPRDAVAALVARVESLGRDAWPLKVAGAGHSAAVDPILEDLAQSLAGIAPRPATVPVYSSVLLDPRETPTFDNAYWVANARQAVRFTQAVAAAAADGFTTFIEVSPHPVASAAISKSLQGANVEGVIVGSLRRDNDDALAFAANAAKLHVHGHPVLLLPAGATGRFVDLPRTVWRHERFWFTPPARAIAPLGDPFLGAHVELPEGGRHLWSNQLGAQELAGIVEVKAFAVTVVPAAFFLEAILSAGAAGLDVPSSEVVVTDFALDAPLTRSEQTEITTSFSSVTGAVEIFSRGSKHAAWVLNASARVTSSVTAPPPVPADATSAAVAAAQNPSHSPVFSPRAAVLDELLQTASAEQATTADESDESPAIVTTIASLRVVGDIDAGGRVVTAELDADRCLWLLDDSGEITAFVRGWQSRTIDRLDVVVPASRLLYRTSFVPTPLPAQPASTAASNSAIWLLLDAESAPLLSAQVTDGLRELGHDVRRAPAGELSATLAGLHDEGSEVGSVILFAAQPSPEEISAPMSSLPRDEGFVLTVGQVAATLTDQISTKRTRLWIATSGAAGVAPGEAGRPGQAALRAAVRVLALEQPGARATLVDVDPLANGGDLLRELLADHVDDEVVWRDGERFSSRLEAAAARPVGATPVRAGAYVLSGGTGGIGLVFARWLSDNGASRIVLTSRRTPSPEALDELNAWPAEIVFVPGDITDPEVAVAAVAAATSDGTPLRGVAHLAAARLNDQLYGDLTVEALGSIWQTKIIGAWNLHAAAIGHQLDWFISFSSMAAVVGSPGQVSYATANAWLDAFSAWQNAHGVPGYSINWGAWLKVGGAAAIKNVLLDPITPTEALQALDVVLSSGQTRATIALLDPPRAISLLPGLLDMPFFSTLLRDVDAQSEVESEWQGAAAIRDADPTVAATMLTARLRERVAAVMGSQPENLDVNTPLIDMGFDSLMATRAKNAVEHDLGLTLPIRLVLQGATLLELAVHIGNELGVDMSAVTDGGQSFVSANASMPGNNNPLQLRPDGATTAYMPPRDPTERFLVLVWQDVLQRRPVGVNENFYDLGGTAESALEVAQLITERLGTAPSAEALFAGPTIAEMSDLIREQLEGNGGSPVRVLRGTGSRTPVFMFHPAGGPTSVYQPLVSMLDPEQPVYGFERIDDADTIEAKVARYIPLIREIQPHGPYRLMGWSFGGVLAGETAHQLVEAGEEVDVLARIDTIIPLVDPDQELHELLVGRYQRFAEYILETYDKVLEIPYDDLPNMTEQEHIAIFRDALTSVGVGMPPGVLEHQYTSYVDARIAERYQPKLFHGRMILYRASLHEAIAATIDPRYRRTDEKLGWDEYSTNIEVIRVPGDHISMIDRPNVDAIAAHFDGVLADLAARVL
ncbi:phthiocerol/phenolphthiocerol synthesis type-I polyketide synthase D [Jatrophihabitans sp. GAS493]|uniref:type I polyketide synthase n=1 Tax=Jatrophihabitans sp. GAS493 TaxID=1907575 RepID=UPI000BB6D97E|nr:type I polyketide synthase [Jatrophihabitans sp. GAS493]SOD71629.1 phthiocerol/phenolphthiocerol synthesis type-I polyketide synthase D [Jatrophihabitans sp. GAS493]